VVYCGCSPLAVRAIPVKSVVIFHYHGVATTRSRPIDYPRTKKIENQSTLSPCRAVLWFRDRFSRYCDIVRVLKSTWVKGTGVSLVGSYSRYKLTYTNTVLNHMKARRYLHPSAFHVARHLGAVNWRNSSGKLS